MRVTTQIQIGAYAVTLYVPDGWRGGTMIYLHEAQDEMRQAAAALADSDVVFAVIDGIDWNRDLSPWPAKKAFRGAEDFAGSAQDYLSVLTEQIVPAVENALPCPPTVRVLAGYSMAGLFAIYALYRTDSFTCAASVSGSLWYDGFAEFAREGTLRASVERVYFSLGDAECHTKNPRMAAVERCTEEVVQIMRERCDAVHWEKNPGGHFSQIPQRIEKALRWLLRSAKDV